MERLRERLEIAGQALGTLEEVLKQPVSDVVHHSAILRFVFSFESVWKAAQLYLAKEENLESGSPAGVIRGCWKAGVLSEAETEGALKMANDRNLAVHTYLEPLAIEVYGRLTAHATLLRGWLNRLGDR